MKQTIIIGMTIGLLTACSTTDEEPVPAPDGKVQVEFQLPGTYGVNVSHAQSKAVDNLDPNWHDLPEANATLLPVGSTLWLSYAKQNDDDTYSKPDLQGYVVGTNASGYNTLYPCTTTERADGKLTLNPEAIGAPLYLETGTYKFKMISPAYPIDKELKMQVDNGMYLYSTDGRYEETSSRAEEIIVNATGVQYIKLNPIISQVARFTFTIQKGKGVNRLEPLAAGIEISGLQNPYNHLNESEEGDNLLTYNWSSEDIADTLVMHMGDKRSWVTLPGEELQVDEDGTITGDIAVLPTLTMSTPISILINMAINGVPTQYMTLLNEQMLLHARSYNLKWEVSVTEGQISVVTWQNQSWVTDLVNEE